VKNRVETDGQPDRMVPLNVLVVRAAADHKTTYLREAGIFSALIFSGPKRKKP